MTELPADTPVTTPPAVIVALAGVALLQVPPAVALLRVVVDPTHTLVVPVMAAGSGLTVKLKFCEVELQLLPFFTVRVNWYVPGAAAPGIFTVSGLAPKAAFTTGTNPAMAGTPADRL